MNLKKLSIYVVLAYGFTWLLWLPLLLNYQWNLNLRTIPGQFYIASFGPIFGAVIASLMTGGHKSLAEWGRRTYSLKFKFRWFLVALGLPIFYAVAAVIAHKVVTGTWPIFSEFGLTKKLPGMNVVQTAIVWILTFGIGEESGWRGFLLPELYKKFSLLKSSLIVAVIWMLWHLPAFWFNENYINMGLGMIGWAVSLSFGSVFLAWFCYESKFSIIPVLFWHGGFDLLTASDQAGQVMAMVCSMIVIFQGVILCRKLRRVK